MRATDVLALGKVSRIIQAIHLYYPECSAPVARKPVWMRFRNSTRLYLSKIVFWARTWTGYINMIHNRYVSELKAVRKAITIAGP